jgi:hypothetical protein
MVRSINLVFSTSRRLEYFQITLRSLVEKNPEIQELVQKIFILDDRSSKDDREMMRFLVSHYFGKEKVHLITFDCDQPYGYVEKLNFLGKLSCDGEYTLFIEDDWLCLDSIELEKHIWTLENTEADLITFSENFYIQEISRQEVSDINDLYWKNPWPMSFRHTIERSDTGWLYWTEVKINNFSLNPSLLKAGVFRKSKFLKEEGYEIKFSDHLSFSQYFTKTHKFIHIGNESFEKKSELSLKVKSQIAEWTGDGSS